MVKWLFLNKQTSNGLMEGKLLWFPHLCGNTTRQMLILNAKTAALQLAGQTKIVLALCTSLSTEPNTQINLTGLKTILTSSTEQAVRIYFNSKTFPFPGW